MAEIPTMACPECDGRPLRMNENCTTYGCTDCDGTGRIPRPPLTAEEIAALPDGARVVVDYDDVAPGCLRGGVITSDRDRAAAQRLVLDGVRVWLAVDSGEG